MLNSYIKTDEGLKFIEELSVELNIDAELFRLLYDLKSKSRVEGGKINKMMEIISKYSEGETSK